MMLRRQYLIDSSFWCPPYFLMVVRESACVTAPTERQIEQITLRMHEICKLAMKILEYETVQRK